MGLLYPRSRGNAKHRSKVFRSIGGCLSRTFGRLSSYDHLGECLHNSLWSQNMMHERLRQDHLWRTVPSISHHKENIIVRRTFGAGEVSKRIVT